MSGLVRLEDFARFRFLKEFSVEGGKMLVNFWFRGWGAGGEGWTVSLPWCCFIFYLDDDLNTLLVLPSFPFSLPFQPFSLIRHRIFLSLDFASIRLDHYIFLSSPF